MQGYSSVSMKLARAAIPLALLLAHLLPAAAAPMEENEEYLHVSASAPGQVVAVAAMESERFRVRLSTGNGEIVSRAEAFEYLSGEGLQYAVALLALPSNLRQGEYTLQVVSLESDSILSTSILQVQERSFRSETIPLRQSLTKLRREPDMRKHREALEIQRIYARFTPTHTYDGGVFLMPVEWRRISSYYGDRREYEYVDGGTARSIHTGVDLAADTGTPVQACAAGKVVLAKDRVISGYSVVLAHLPGVYSVYFHLDSLAVAEGDTVSRGQEIGTVGMTGLATGPHLHWEVRVNEVAVDPRQLTKSGLIGIIHSAGAARAPQ